MDPHVLIVTGAGASTRLGADERPLPMMTDWAASLVDELKYAAELLGLRRDMPGDEFEGALGRFIAFSEALDTVEALHEMGRFDSVITEPERAQVKNNSEQWLSLARNNVRRVREVLHRNLYEQFGQDRIDDERAANAYGKLHTQIRNAFREKGPVFLAHATTNFDHAIEAAIEHSNDAVGPQRVLDGFGQSYGGKRRPWAPNLLTYSSSGDNEVPVLHLHGAVGWYFSDDGQAVTQTHSDDVYNPELTPALLLPDDKKDVTRFPGPLAQVWDQFVQLCMNSTHIIVLGHSLHDKHLVRVLQQSGKPIAVVAYAPGFDETTPQARAAHSNQYSELLPGAELIPGDFARRSEKLDIGDHQLGEWLRYQIR